MTCLSNSRGKMVEELKVTFSMRHSDIVVAAISARRWWYWLWVWDTLRMVPVVWMNMYGHRVRSSIVRCVIDRIHLCPSSRSLYTQSSIIENRFFLAKHSTVFLEAKNSKIRYYNVGFLQSCDCMPSSSVSFTLHFLLQFLE